MKSNNILLGLFTGVLFVALFTPIITIYGFTKESSLILLYMLPLCGAATALAIDSLSYDKGYENETGGGENIAKAEIAKSFANDNEKQIENKYKEFENQKIRLEKTNGETYEGLFKSIGSGSFSIDNAKRADSNSIEIFDHIFVNENEIKSITKIMDPSSSFQESVM